MHRPQNRTAALLAAFGCALAYLPAGRALAAVCAALPLSAAGQSFALHSGKNKMGRSQEFDIRLLNDESVSRSCVAAIVFDTKMGAFSIIPGDSDSLCYVNGEALYERKSLVGYEQIELGDSERNMFVFVPLCGEQFSWNSYQAAK